jgi:poly-gamma-glutamate synthesis protein (capsule biosynthesis protein)
MDRQVCLFVCGDVMTGRGIDQILPHPSDPRLYEPYVDDARDYLRLAEAAHGPIRRPVTYDYIWGDVLKELEQAAPDVRIVNLETSITIGNDPWPDKEVHYRMHPGNVGCLAAAGIDCCALANNHVLDWGYEGLAETLATLDEAGIRHAGAGANLAEAESPAILPVKNVTHPSSLARDGDRGQIADFGLRIADSSRDPSPQSEITNHVSPDSDPGPKSPRILVFSFGSVTSGIPLTWAARHDRPGVNLLEDLSEGTSRRSAAKMRETREPGDLIIASIHWGSNWGYEIPEGQIHFAHALSEEGVDLVHGHSSHHAKAFEIYRGRPILYGCGDFLTDYEGIRGHEAYRGDLALMYLIRFAPSSGGLIDMRLVPLQVRRLRLRHATPADAQWLQRMLNREGGRFGTKVSLNADHSLSVDLPGT